jgi:hypothetical protein
MSKGIKKQLLETADKLDKLAASLETLDKVAEYKTTILEKHASATELSLGSIGDKPVLDDNPLLDFLIG